MGVYNGQMFKEEKNLKDSERKPSASYGAGPQSVSVTGSLMSYTKTNKLVTALYMVTDILDKDEPLRNKLRTLGLEILSDISMSKMPFDILKISQVLSFLDIAVAVNIVSEMNYSILKKEFLELDQSIKEVTGSMGTVNKQINLTEFFKESSGGKFDPYPTSPLIRGRSKEGVFFGQENPKGHTRIGVQKGSTLLKALSDVGHPTVYGFDMLKKQRRDDIINIIKTIGGNVTIKDIKDKIQNSTAGAGSLVSYGEKTLQRELVSMVKDNVLNKIGEKRWSRYKVVNLRG